MIVPAHAAPAVSRRRGTDRQPSLVLALWTVLVATSALSSAAWGAPALSGHGNERSLPLEQTPQEITRDLTAQGYQVERGYPMLVTQQDCDRYTFPIMETCYGNNPASPYVVLVMKSWEDEFVDPATVNAFGKTRRGYSATYRLDPREAIVVLAQLPPPGRYMGLESWVFTKEWLT
jgi:hypothetical protein